MWMWCVIDNETGKRASKKKKPEEHKKGEKANSRLAGRFLTFRRSRGPGIGSNTARYETRAEGQSSTRRGGECWGSEALECAYSLPSAAAYTSKSWVLHACSRVPTSPPSRPQQQLQQGAGCCSLPQSLRGRRGLQGIWASPGPRWSEVMGDAGSGVGLATSTGLAPSTRFERWMLREMPRSCPWSPSTKQLG